jgi:hypothetical protein
VWQFRAAVGERGCGTIGARRCGCRTPGDGIADLL